MNRGCRSVLAHSLMARRLVTADEGFEMLRAVSQSSHRKLREIVEIVVQTGELPATA